MVGVCILLLIGHDMRDDMIEESYYCSFAIAIE